jgi:hypothetical protein
MTNQEIYKLAAEKWGNAKQLIKAIEELSELQKELCKVINTPNVQTILRIAEEVADVEIMLEQIHFIFSFRDEKFSELVDANKDMKLERLENRLKDLES